MKKLRLVLITMAMVAASAGVSAAQVVIQIQPKAGPGVVSDADYNQLVDQVFAPITEQLNLTNEQKVKIVEIVNDIIVKTDSLYNQLDDLDDQLFDVALAPQTDDAKIRYLADQQGQVMSRIIAMKTMARARMVQILTPAQRAMVAKLLGSRGQPEARLGAISN
jgi:Spy/CpxP family protein refolding chaperone